MPRLAALAVVSLPALAAAQDRPPTLPTRDVAVTYAVSGAAVEALPGGSAGALRLAWDAAGRRLHLGAEGQPQAAIVNLGERRAVILDEGMHAAITLPLGARSAADMALTGARFRREGTAQVAGFSCTDYAVEDAHGSGTLCLTADGVPLRGDGTWNGQAARFVATHVDYSAQPDALFRAPPGFVQLAIPKILGTKGNQE